MKKEMKKGKMRLLMRFGIFIKMINSKQHLNKIYCLFALRLKIQTIYRTRYKEIKDNKFFSKFY